MSWQRVPLRKLIALTSVRDRSDLPLLSVVRDIGVIVRRVELRDNHNVIPDDLSNYKVVNRGQFVINKMKAWQGSCGVSMFDGIVSPAYYVFNLNIDNEKFFNYSIRSMYFVGEFCKISKGIRVDQWDLDIQQLRYLRFPLPPRDEQDQIVRYLDWKVSQINKLINAKKKQIALLQEYMQGVINKAVTEGGEGWKEIALGNLGKFRKGYGGSRSDDLEDGLPCIRYGDIYRSGEYSLNSPITRINPNLSDLYARVYTSEILFTLSGETKEDIGMAIVNNISEDTWCSGDCAIMRTNDLILPKFLVYAIRASYVVTQRMSLAKGDIIVHLSTNAIRRLRLLTPPISIQQKIVSALDNLYSVTNRMILGIQHQIDLLHEYRTRLISDVVTGKLDVREVDVPKYQEIEEVSASSYTNLNEVKDDNYGEY